MELVLLLSEVTLLLVDSIAIGEGLLFVALLMNMIEIKCDLIFIRSSSFAVAYVFLIRLKKPVVRAGQAELRTILVPWAGLG